MSKEKRIIIVYVVCMAFLYMVFPLSYAINWYHFFDPVRHGFMPYVDFQTGYPVLGFIPYNLLALLSPSPLFYGYLMRYVNLALISVFFLIIYKVVEMHRDQKDALLTLLAMMLSISIIGANPYSNDVMALLFSALALLFLMKKRSSLCGISTGLAILAKLYPVIMLPFFLAFFEKWRERLFLFISLILTVLLLNFPFLVLNPYMWSETILGGNAGRGPWETIWAFLSGYYSHGGVESMHPYFEGFFSYAQLGKIYPLSSVDHAFYLYSNSLIPLVMNLFLLLSLILPLMLFRKKKILEIIGLCGALFFLASKGYSPEFTIFTIPLLALSVPYKRKLVLTALLDVATVLQMMNWSGWFAPFGEGVFLPYAVVLRTAVLILAAVVCFSNVTTGISIRKVITANIRSFIVGSARSLWMLFNNRRYMKGTVPLLTLILVFAFLFSATYGSYKGRLASYDRTLEINTYEMSLMTINHDFKDRIYFVIPRLLHLLVNVTDCYVEDVNLDNTTRIFLIPYHQEATDVYIKLLYPITDFSIDEVLINNDIEKVKGCVEFHQEDSSLTVTAKNPDQQRSYLLYVSWLVNFTINESTEICANLTHVNGLVHDVSLDLVDEKGPFYSAELIPKYSRSVTVWQRIIDLSSTDISGKNFFDFLLRNVTAMNLVMALEPGESAAVKIDVLSYCVDGNKTELPLTVQDNVACDVKVYVGEFFNLENPAVGIFTWCVPVVATIYAYYFVRRVKVESSDDK